MRAPTGEGVPFLQMFMKFEDWCKGTAKEADNGALPLDLFKLIWGAL